MDLKENNFNLILYKKLIYMVGDCFTESSKKIENFNFVTFTKNDNRKK